MFDLSKIVNAVLMSDSYKNSHYGFSPKGLTEIYSNGTPRFDYYFKEKYPEFEGKYVQFGHQYMVRMIHSMYETFFKTEKSEAIKQISDVLGPYLNETNYERHKKLHSLGYLPVEFRALEEGSLVNIGVPSFTIRNTHPDFSWMTNYLETIISCELWKPMTVATVARQFHLLSKKYSDKTCDSDVHLNFQNHDFSFRGQGSLLSDAICGAAFLTHSIGTDNIPAIPFVNEFYNGKESGLIGLSVPASEHATNCVAINLNDSLDLKSGEDEFLKQVLTEYYPTGLVSYVADTYDYWGFLTEIIPDNKDLITSRDGKLVVRPDSGDPIRIVCGYTITEVEQYNIDDYFKEVIANGLLGSIECIKTRDGKYYSFKPKIDAHGEFNYNCKEIQEYEAKGSIDCLWSIFGGTVNSKGYKELDQHIGLIYGDGITYHRASEIFKRLEDKGFASNNIVYGIGSYSLNLLSRDDLGFAIKATHAIVDGKNIPICKNPKTDSTKKSAKGYLKVKKVNDDFVLTDNVTLEESCLNSDLKLIFKDGEFFNETSLKQIRDNVGFKVTI